MVVALMLVFTFKLARRSLPGAASGTAQTNGIAPDFTLQSIDGKTVRLSDFRGKAVVLNFWATWCGPCKIEMPWFVDFQKQYGPAGVQFLGVAMDDASTKDIAEFAQSMKVNYPILIGKEAVGDAYGGVQFLPETFYVDRNGKIVDKAFGLKGRGEIEDDIKKIAGQPL
jgi:thiol-disulfide isomerase/thioredoxin